MVRCLSLEYSLERSLSIYLGCRNDRSWRQYRRERFDPEERREYRDQCLLYRLVVAASYNALLTLLSRPLSRMRNRHPRLCWNDRRDYPGSSHSYQGRISLCCSYRLRYAVCQRFIFPSLTSDKGSNNLAVFNRVMARNTKRPKTMWRIVNVSRLRL